MPDRASFICSLHVAGFFPAYSLTHQAPLEDLLLRIREKADSDVPVDPLLGPVVDRLRLKRQGRLQRQERFLYLLPRLLVRHPRFPSRVVWSTPLPLVSTAPGLRQTM